MRLKALQRILESRGISAALLVNTLSHPSPDFFCLTGCSVSGFLVVTPEKAVLLVNDMDFLAAKESGLGYVKRSSDIIKDLKSLLSGKKVIGIDKDRTSLNSFARLKGLVKAKFVDISPICSDLRVVKTPGEIRLEKQACAITDDLFHQVFMHIRQFRSESDIAAFLVSETHRLGLESAFPPIVASGSNAAKPHHIPSASPLRKGFCVIDYGVRYRGVCSDMTRTIFIGKPSEKDIDLYHRVLDAQLKSIDFSVQGRSFFDIDVYAKKLLGPYARNMNHSVGHGVGFECHERPFVRRTRKESGILLPDCIMTVEPGVYFPGKGGIRIEDTVLITEKGPIPLTKTGKNLLIIRK